MREKFKKKFYEFKKLLFHRNTAPFVLAEPLQLYKKSLIRSFCVAKLQRALVLLFHRCSNARVLAEPLQLYNKSLFRSFCVAKLQRALVLLFHRCSNARVLAFPGLRKSQNQCFVKHFSCKLHTNWHVIF